MKRHELPENERLAGRFHAVRREQQQDDLFAGFRKDSHLFLPTKFNRHGEPEIDVEQCGKA